MLCYKEKRNEAEEENPANDHDDDVDIVTKSNGSIAKETEDVTIQAGCMHHFINTLALEKKRKCHNHGSILLYKSENSRLQTRVFCNG